jgi:hypothetical protein
LALLLLQLRQNVQAWVVARLLLVMELMVDFLLALVCLVKWWDEAVFVVQPTGSGLLAA